MPVIGIICITVLIILSLGLVLAVAFCLLPLFNLDQAGREYRAERKKAVQPGLPHVIGRQQICPHENRVPVTSMEGDVIAQLCLGCDAQLDADWVPRASWCPYGEFPSFPPIYDLPPFTPDPRLTRRISE